MAAAAAAAPAVVKRHWSYEQIQELIRHAVVEVDIFRDFQPTLIVCIAAGGFVPTRILRSCLKARSGANVSIQTIGLQLYDIEGADPATSPVQRVQWLSYGTGPGQLLLQGHRILLVDEVDDSRKTLSCAVTELQADIDREQRQHAASRPGEPWRAPQLGVFVVHNKQREKLAQLPQDLMQHRYFAALDIANCWCVYPWDADDIYAHTQTAEAAGGANLPPSQQQARGKRQSSGGQQLLSPTAGPAAAANGHAANGGSGSNGSADAAAANGCGGKHGLANAAGAHTNGHACNGS